MSTDKKKKIVKPVTLSEQAYAIIKDEIITINDCLKRNYYKSDQAGRSIDGGAVIRKVVH